MKKETAERRLLVEEIHMLESQIKTIDKNWQEKQLAIVHELSKTQSELAGIYKQIALIYLSEKQPLKEEEFPF
jgi:hypothetical protein